MGLFALLLVPALASADEPSEKPPLVSFVEKRVTDTLVKPLREIELGRSRFSRARQPPHERRVRVTQTTTTLDKAGRAFLTFAIDVRYGSEWHEDDIVGCAYTANGELFVKRGDTYRPASVLLGKNADPVSGVCQAGGGRS